MPEKEIETFCPTSSQEWRQWLQENHLSKSSIWLVQYKVKSGKPSITWSEAVDQALCFGWIDSTKKSLDHETFIQFFCPRKPKSVWSKINKVKVQNLIAEGLMTPAGYASIEIAQKNGSWNTLDEAEALTIPADLEAGFAAQPGSKDSFWGLSKSAQKTMLQWLILAKQPVTRQKRIGEIVERAMQKLKPKQLG